MPIVLQTPITSPVVAKKEIIAFTIDLEHGKLHLMFADLTADGQRVGQSTGTADLYAPDGTPLFTLNEYGVIKLACYRIAMGAGIVQGTHV